jgi:hypothetical protein
MKIWPVALFDRVYLFGGTSKECNRNTVPTSVIIGRRMKRLVQVTDEVNKESLSLAKISSVPKMARPLFATT